MPTTKQTQARTKKVDSDVLQLIQRTASQYEEYHRITSVGNSGLRSHLDETWQHDPTMPLSLARCPR